MFKKPNGKNECLSYVSFDFNLNKKALCYIGYFDPQFNSVVAHSYKKPAVLTIWARSIHEYTYSIEDIDYETKKDWEEAKEFYTSLK